MMHDRRGSNQRILDQVIGAPVHERCPRPEDAGINRKNVPGLRDKIDPGLDLGSLVRVLFDIRAEKVQALSIQHGRFPSAARSARRYKNFRSRCGGEQELLQRRACRFFQSTPLIDGYEDGHLHSSSSDDLRPFGDAGLQQFTEARFGVLHRPRSGFFFSRHFANPVR